MRDIEFRGKRKGCNHEWAHGYLMNMYEDDRLFIGKWIIIGGEATVKDELFFSYHEVIPETVGQYTGLLDKNGVKIFEGDIIKVPDQKKEINEVAFDEGAFCAGTRYKGNFVATWYLSVALMDDDCEVIGNIHDNPELLEAK